MSGPPRRGRIVHVVYSFAVGGLENGIVQLINRLPAERFEHVVLLLSTISDFKRRITQTDVVNICNMVGLEIVPLSWLARVPLRIHAEHGWDAHDQKGEPSRCGRLRKRYKSSVSHYVVVSKYPDEYLAQAVGVPVHRRSLIANGVGILPMPGCIALPLRAEGVSCTLQKAMASGLPVVATAVGGTLDVVEERITGLHVPPNDANAMDQPLWSLCANAARARFMAQTARLQAVKRFCIGATVHPYDSLFSVRQLGDSLRSVPGNSRQS